MLIQTLISIAMIYFAQAELVSLGDILGLVTLAWVMVM
ncbi:hypothetical protein P4S63_13910 [Pseudoalteromonas sp. B193]